MRLLSWQFNCQVRAKLLQEMHQVSWFDRSAVCCFCFELVWWFCVLCFLGFWPQEILAQWKDNCKVAELHTWSLLFWLKTQEVRQVKQEAANFRSLSLKVASTKTYGGRETALCARNRLPPNQDQSNRSIPPKHQHRPKPGLSSSLSHWFTPLHHSHTVVQFWNDPSRL